ncbi:MAG TPA: hypothetical protein V6C88_14925, partial [Chroococcidiopsis sp.]
MTTQSPYISRPHVEELLEALALALTQPAQQPVVFHAWGIGGVGKSTLTRNVSDRHRGSAHIATVSFGLTENVDDPLALMVNLYSQIVQPDGWNSDPFHDRYDLYRETLSKLETETVSGKGIVGEEQIKHVKQLASLVAGVGGEFLLPELGKKLLETGIDRSIDASVAFLSLKDSVVQLLQQHHATKRDKALR